jgi:membrane-associated protein
MSSISDFLLTGLIAYGPPVFALSLLIGAMGIPLPTTLVVIAAGAFSRQGMLDWALASVLGLLGSILGDSISYGLGHYAGSWAQKRFGSSPAWLKARSAFDRRGGVMIYLTRFILTAIALPINLIAGSSGYSFWRFLGFDAAGELTWIVLFGGLGYLFGSQWELISQLISDFSGVLLGVLILGAGIYLARRYWNPGKNSPDLQPAWVGIVSDRKPREE